jgi:hypothetical protein
MSYERELAACEDAEIGAAVSFAIGELLRHDFHLLRADVSERAIAARVALYLGQHLPNQHVDVEYNRNGADPKRVRLDDVLSNVVPDIIVHHRGSQRNTLAMEIKKGHDPAAWETDTDKLRAYRHDLGYLHALFVSFGVKEAAGSVLACSWVR